MSTSHEATPDAGFDPRRDVPPRVVDRDPRDPAIERAVLGRRAVVHAEQQQFGGIKIGSAFFGWLADRVGGAMITFWIFVVMAIAPLVDLKTVSTRTNSLPINWASCRI